MYTDKDSYLISDFRTKYGEESVGSIRNWGKLQSKKWQTTGITGGSHAQVYKGQYYSSQLQVKEPPKN